MKYKTTDIIRIQPGKHKIEIFSVSIAVLFYLFRATVPMLKYPLILCFICLFLYAFIDRRKQLVGKVKEYFKAFSIVLVLAFILLISFIGSDKLYLVVFKDCTNTILLLLLFFLLLIYIESKDDLKLLFKNLILLIIYTAIYISIIILCKFFDINSLYVTSIGSISNDYNFALLPVFFGIVSVVYLLIERVSFVKKVFYNIVLIFFSNSIILSGSRRGIIILVAFTLVLSITLISSILTRNLIFRRIISKYSLFALLFICQGLLLWFYTFNTSDSFKKRTIESLDLGNSVKVKDNIAGVIFRYFSIFNTNSNYQIIYNKLWNQILAKSLDPDLGWANGKHKILYPLRGKNIEIIPNYAKGYMLDSTCDVSSISNNIVFYKSLFETKRVKNGDLISASVYCFVSNDFDGNSVGISLNGAAIDSKESNYQIFDSTSYFFAESENLLVNGNFSLGTQYWISWADSTSHDLIDTPYGKGLRISRTNGNGVDWSLLYDGKPIIYYSGHRYQIKFKFKVIKGVDVPFNIGWWVNEGNQGYSSSALPLEIKSLNDGWNEAVCSYKFLETHKNLMNLLNSLKDHSIVDIADIEIVDLNRDSTQPAFAYSELLDKGVWQKLSLFAKCNDGDVSFYLNLSKTGVIDFSTLKGYVVFAFPEFEIINTKESSISIFDANGGSRIESNLFASSFSFDLDNLKLDGKEDPIRDLVSKLVIEDTTYYGLENEIIIDTISNKFLGDRLMRWQFAQQVFIKEYGWKQKIFGDGFNFLNWFGYRFFMNKAVSDYPHNPFLSILLYSGIFGLLIYIIFIYRSFYYYIRYFADYQIFFIFFLICNFFSFFSSGSPFDPPIMGFFIILPFFINHIHTRKF